MSKEREQGIAKANDNDISFPVIMAEGYHLFPYRTQKLSLIAPKVLGGQPPGRIGRRRGFLCLNLYCKCSSEKFLCPRVCIIDTRAFFDFVGGRKLRDM